MFSGSGQDGNGLENPDIRKSSFLYKRQPFWFLQSITKLFIKSPVPKIELHLWQLSDKKRVVKKNSIFMFKLLILQGLKTLATFDCFWFPFFYLILLISWRLSLLAWRQWKLFSCGVCNKILGLIQEPNEFVNEFSMISSQFENEECQQVQLPSCAICNKMFGLFWSVL